ncbi:phosphoglucomutase/phosphomannomutase family protein [Geoalkalibacter halelectricus]|uniref:Phosphoglucomutase/phosphomannomutase family protein n=1 Tax=Geoalkalibacter halelectricus TaxID=2847045 RepID=A0ABY5ZL52_9BACT|nr:phosphoglucomutase/phosphomannomutase family protein [Geoalkalibacter halelectricus]MDO3376569.1 phosphoglucomutase/phosphomannomutase family protein [Geoalkalibacter halelectricus]UWZ78469.1 phosphoglucomutase/phosphomannomutase family protein [Geoalkalibacter halelectricus]
MGRIKFGTSGWRGILCEDFIFDNVKVVTQAIADHLRETGEAEQGLVIGYDARFMGERFAHEAARVLAGAGIPAFVCNRDTPTPVIAFEILRRGAAGGINFTASHNPPEYNGLKFSPSWGGPALPETTLDIEKRANAMLGQVCYREMPLDQAVRAGLVEKIDPRPAYFDAIRKLVDLKAIADAGLVVAVNPMYGTGRGYLDTLLKEAGVKVVTINDHRDPYFGGLPPEPSQSHIPDFIKLVAGDPEIRLGLATDGDADRYGIVDGDGTFIEPNYVLALLLDYLLRHGKMGDAARSVATSHFIDAVASHHGVKVRETPVGFKFIGEFIRDNQILIGGEESAGLTVRGHVPDKDGILACLLVAEMVAVEGKSMKDLLCDLYDRVGEFHTRRDNVHLSPELESSFPEKLASPPAELAGKKIARVITLDGCKFLFEDGTWVLFRKSGTEPVVRVYGEAGTEDELGRLMKAAAQFIGV